MLVEQVNPSKDPFESPLAPARAPMAIMQEGWAVHADTQVYVRTPEERTPAGVDQGGVGLK